MRRTSVLRSIRRYWKRGKSYPRLVMVHSKRVFLLKTFMQAPSSHEVSASQTALRVEARQRDFTAHTKEA